MAQPDKMQRLIDLTVDEVSLVDNPANQQEFLVIKRLNPNTGKGGENDMDDNKDVKDDEKTKHDESKGNPPAADSKDVSKETKPEGSEAGKGEPTEVEKALPPALMKQVKDLIEALQKLIKGDYGYPYPAPGKKEEKQKSEEKGGEQDVSKAKMASGRLKRFKDAVETLTLILKEVEGGPEIQLAQVSQVNAEVSKSLEEIKGEVKTLSERIEKIETTKGVSKSLDGKEEPPAPKGKDPFWAGVFE